MKSVKVIPVKHLVSILVEHQDLAQNVANNLCNQYQIPCQVVTRVDVNSSKEFYCLQFRKVPLKDQAAAIGLANAMLRWFTRSTFLLTPHSSLLHYSRSSSSL